MTSGEGFFARLPRTLLIVGKGGVGKTTCAAGLATHFANAGERVLVLTTDPAGTLADVIAPTARRMATTAPTPIAPHLDGWLVDTTALRNTFLDRWRETFATIIDRGTYLDRADIDGMIDAALPGADEIFALLALGDLIADTSAQGYERIVVDTAPTGHTLRLLDLPTTFRALVDLLETMQDKHRFMVRALTHRYRRDASDELIGQLRGKLGDLTNDLTDPTHVAAILVSRPEPVVVAESSRYVLALEGASTAVHSIVMNSWTGTARERDAVTSFRAATSTIEWFTLPTVDPPPDTLANAGELIERIAPLTKTGRAGARRAGRGAAHRIVEEEDLRIWEMALPLTIVGGKGGVGKTTVACALAIAAADAGEQVLLVSTDPAPSVADALGQAIGDNEQPVIGVERLIARQMDAAAAFARLRDEYRDRIDQVFAGLVTGGIDAAHDRAILRDLLSLSPPGIDELYALSVLGEALDEARYSRIVVDPAPTGHLLRLLDMPSAALEWSHRLMRLLLKYKEIVGLGDAAEAVLGFARRTRALDQRLHAPTLSGVVEVVLDEPLVRTESARLVGELRARPIHVEALVWNRCVQTPGPLPVEPPLPQVLAPAAEPAPVGVDALRVWTRRWTRLVA